MQLRRRRVLPMPGFLYHLLLRRPCSLAPRAAVRWGPPRKRRRSTGGSSKRPQRTRGTAYVSGWPQGTGAWRDFHENITARLPYVDPSTGEYARTLRHLQPAGYRRWTHGREPRNPETRAQSTQPHALGTQGVGSSAADHRPFGGAPPAPPRSPGRRGGAAAAGGGGAPTWALCSLIAVSGEIRESSAATHRSHGLDAQALWRFNA